MMKLYFTSNTTTSWKLFYFYTNNVNPNSNCRTATAFYVQYCIYKHNTKYTSQKLNKLAFRNQANQTYNNVSASIPQGTKDFMSSAKQIVLDSDNLRSFSVFFGTGEESAYSLSCNPTVLCPRLKNNLFFFYLNYILVAAVVTVIAWRWWSIPWLLSWSSSSPCVVLPSFVRRPVMV